MARANRIIKWFDRWQPWMVICYFALAAMIVVLFILFSRTAHEAAAREATQKAANTAQVTQCYAAVRNFPAVNGFIDAQQALISNSLIATTATLRLTDPSSSLYKVRQGSLRRLRADRAKIDALEALIRKNTPTQKQCARLAAMLKVPAPPAVPKRASRTAR